MAIDGRGRILLLAALLATCAPATAAPPVAGPEVEREVVAPGGVDFKPAATDEEGAIDRFADYTLALARCEYAAVYAMLRPSLQASSPRLDWEADLRKRGGLWADGTIRILRLTWYLDPAGQPSGLYAAFDFRGDRRDGTMDCGYVVVHRAAPAAPFTVVRTDTSEVPHAMIEEGVIKEIGRAHV